MMTIFDLLKRRIEPFHRLAKTKRRRGYVDISRRAEEQDKRQASTAVDYAVMITASGYAAP